MLHLLARGFAPLRQFGRVQSVGPDGPEVRIGPSMALSLSMVIHELATNAAKYGALSSEAGHVQIRWNLTPNGACGRLTFTWKEVGGPNVVQPSQAGFGTRLIGGALAEELDGEYIYLTHRAASFVPSVRLYL